MAPLPFSNLNLSSSGVYVPISYCVDDPPPTEVACEVACSADCVVGPWSSWSPCSHTCATKTAEGRQSRTRIVLAIPGKGNAFTDSLWLLALVLLSSLVFSFTYFPSVLMKHSIL